MKETREMLVSTPTIMTVTVFESTPGQEISRSVILKEEGGAPEVGAIIGTKLENRTKDPMKLFQSKIATYIMRECKKGRDLVTIIKKIEEVDTSKWNSDAPTSTGGENSESEMMYNEYLTRKGH